MTPEEIEELDRRSHEDLLQTIGRTIGQFEQLRHLMTHIDYDGIGTWELSQLVQHADAMTDSVVLILRAHVLYLMHRVEANVMRDILEDSGLDDTEKEVLVGRVEHLILMAAGGKELESRVETVGDDEISTRIHTVLEATYFVSRTVNGRYSDTSRFCSVEEARVAGGFAT